MADQTIEPGQKLVASTPNFDVEIYAHEWEDNRDNSGGDQSFIKAVTKDGSTAYATRDGNQIFVVGSSKAIIDPA